MIIDCQYNPNDLIDIIGDRWFSVCDEHYEQVYRHPMHPSTVRIIDCEDVLRIDITADEFGNSLESARALCSLLNQHYELVKP